MGTVVLATPLDDAYANTLAAGARADVVIFHQGKVVASSTASGLRSGDRVGGAARRPAR